MFNPWYKIPGLLENLIYVSFLQAYTTVVVHNF